MKLTESIVVTLSRTPVVVTVCLCRDVVEQVARPYLVEKVKGGQSCGVEQ